MPSKPHNKIPLLPSEWFNLLDIDHVSVAGKTIRMVTDQEQLTRIAERLGVISVSNLEAVIQANLMNGGHILHLEGHFGCDIIQECVSTLKPVASRVDDDFEAWYADHDRAVPFNRAKHMVKTTEEGEEIQMLEEKDDPEPLADGQVDLGEVVIQFLSLSINPYPRNEAYYDEEEGGVVLSSGDESKPLSTLRPNPFAALKNWRPKD